MKRLLANIGIWILTIGGGGTGILYGADTAVDPYTNKGEHYELSLKSDIPQGERVEIHKDKAQMDLVFWNDEQTVSIIPQIPTAQLGGVDRPFTTQANRPLLSKKMEFRSGEVTSFIEPKEGTENEFDIDFTLHSKPDTNVFVYKIEGAENFDFFYQPALTEEKIAQGSSQPENVVGSYAVYHNFKANHRIGGTNYATGKAFHIYRPKAIDANGAEVWAELNYVEGVLSVTVPPKFLDEAVYPVRVDPTFGYITAGASNTFASIPLGNSFVSQEVASITSMSAYAKYLSANVALGMAIYSSSSGLPDTKLAVDSGNATITSSSPSWYTVNISYTTTSGTAYWLFRWTQTTQGYYYYDTSIAKTRQSQSGLTFENWPDPLSENGNGSERLSIYATYTAPSRTISTSNYSFCRTMTMTAGGNSGGVATTTTLKYPLVATSTITDLIATSTGGDVMSLDSDRLKPLDVIFTSDATCYAGSTTALPHYFEKYSSTTGAFTAWIEAPDISSTSAKTISMYYGYATTTSLNSPGQTFATTTALYPVGVWDMSFPNTATTTMPDFLDATYNANHGSSVTASSTSLVTGYLDGAMFFDGGSDHITIPVSSALDLITNYTISLWAKPTGLYQGSLVRRTRAASNSALNDKYSLRLTSNTTLNFNTGDGTTGDTDTFTSTFTADEWVMITCTMTNGDTKECYRNGVSLGTAADGVDASLGTATLQFIGANRDAAGNFYRGTIDDVRFYNYALSDMDVLTLYNNTKSSTIFWTFGDETTQGGGDGKSLLIQFYNLLFEE